MKFAIVKDSLVTNIIEWDGESEYAVDGELIQADENAWVGGEYNGSFVAKPPTPDNGTYVEKRQAEYPSVGDQLDALLKHLNYRRTQGDALVQDLDDIIGDWLNVKSRFPKDD